MTSNPYDPNDPNRAFEYPSQESRPPVDPYAPVDYPATYPPPIAPGYPPFPPPYQGYGADPYAPYPQAPSRGTNGMAIGALVSSLMGLVLCFCFVPSVVGIALGAIAMNQTTRTGQSGHGMALAAVIVGAVAILFGIGFWLLAGLAPDHTSCSGGTC
jgi:Domain of unknown function (DUF4190)